MKAVLMGLSLTVLASETQGESIHQVTLNVDSLEAAAAKEQCVSALCQPLLGTVQPSPSTQPAQREKEASTEQRHHEGRPFPSRPDRNPLHDPMFPGMRPDGMLVGPGSMPRGPRFDPLGPGGVDPDNDIEMPPGWRPGGRPPGQPPGMPPDSMFG